MMPMMSMMRRRKKKRSCTERTLSFFCYDQSFFRPGKERTESPLLPLKTLLHSSNLVVDPFIFSFIQLIVIILIVSPYIKYWSVIILSQWWSSRLVVEQVEGIVRLLAHSVKLGLGLVELRHQAQDDHLMYRLVVFTVLHRKLLSIERLKKNTL